MPVFDDFQRTHTEYKSRREPQFSFLNRSALPEFAEVRRRVDSWYGHMPPQNVGDIRVRLRSTIDAHHYAALFELLIHELLLKLGWSVKPHPSIVGTTHHPDFLASKGGEAVIVEATEVRPVRSIWSSNPLEDDLLDAIDELHSPDFFLSIQTEGELTVPVARARVLGPLRDFIFAHDHQSVKDQIEDAGPNFAPKARIECGAWAIEAALIPKNKLRGRPTRTIGIGPIRGGFTDDMTPLRRAIRAKVGRYGMPGGPYIIAVNAPEVDSIDEEEALFGRGRAANGIWTGGEDKPRHARLSGVLIFRGIGPWSIGSVPVSLYVNPFATFPIPSDLLRLPHAMIENGTLLRKPGIGLVDVFGLHSIHH